jgi:hypothetical protein
MDACLTVTYGVAHSSLRQLPKLQWLQWNFWRLQGLASTAADSGGIKQPL